MNLDEKVCDSNFFCKVVKPLLPEESVDDDKISKGENEKIVRKETKKVKILISFCSFFSKLKTPSQIKKQLSNDNLRDFSVPQKDEIFLRHYKEVWK